jgi:hypothetical protein
MPHRFTSIPEHRPRWHLSDICHMPAAGTPEVLPWAGRWGRNGDGPAFQRPRNSLEPASSGPTAFPRDRPPGHGEDTPADITSAGAVLIFVEDSGTDPTQIRERRHEQARGERRRDRRRRGALLANDAASIDSAGNSCRSGSTIEPVARPLYRRRGGLPPPDHIIVPTFGGTPCPPHDRWAARARRNGRCPPFPWIITPSPQAAPGLLGQAPRTPRPGSPSRPAPGRRRPHRRHTHRLPGPPSPAGPSGMTSRPPWSSSW